jgi:hypothetical protein
MSTHKRSISLNIWCRIDIDNASRGAKNPRFYQVDMTFCSKNAGTKNASNSIHPSKGGILLLGFNNSY